MQRFLSLLRSSIGKKFLMSLTGLVMFLFLVGHLFGNLLIFQSPSAINNYAHWLQSNPLLWPFRISMLLVLILHIFLAISLARENRAARPQRYRIKRDLQVNAAAKYMLAGGILITLFIFFHLAHLTLGWLHPALFQQLDADGLPDVYSRLITGFESYTITGLYSTAILTIGFHLSHALKSIFQTFGFHHRNLQQMVHYLVPIVVVILCLAFIWIPLSVLLGILPGSDNL